MCAPGKYSFVTNLYKLTGSHEIAVSEADKQTLDKLTQTLATFKMSITLCEGASDTNTQRYVRLDDVYNLFVLCSILSLLLPNEYNLADSARSWRRICRSCNVKLIESRMTWVMR